MLSSHPILFTKTDSGLEWGAIAFSINQGKLEVVEQEMARVNVDILGIS